VASVQELEEVECLTAPDFAKDNSIRPMTERCLQQISNGDGSQTVLRLAGLKANKVGVRHADLSRVFDEEDALVGRDEFPED
jgi:hypothetical protein